MNLLIVGTGYVGLVTGTCFAEMGHQVICLDIDQEKIESLKKGNIPFYEPGLAELVKRNVANKRLTFTSSYEEGMRDASISFIAVSTPQAEDESAELRYVDEASRSIADRIRSYHVVVNKSTVPVGTAKRVKKNICDRLAERGEDIPVDVASNPEFLKEGNAILDFMKPDRILIGVDDVRVGALLKELYAPFSISHDRILLMDIESAELTKYAANSMLASRISFMNEIALLCEKAGADIDQVRKGIGSDTRIGYQFLYPGAGYGGSCFPKDIRALRATAKKWGSSTYMLDAVEKVNQRQKQLIAQKIDDYFGGDLENKKMAIWGLSFKPDTDDMRQAPSLTLIKILFEQGVHLRLYDPIAMENAKLYLKGFEEQLTWCSEELEAVENVDAVILMTEWKQFRFIDLSAVLAKMRGNVFFDGRNQYRPKDMMAKGFDYISIGRETVYARQANLQTHSG